MFVKFEAASSSAAWRGFLRGNIPVLLVGACVAAVCVGIVAARSASTDGAMPTTAATVHASKSHSLDPAILDQLSTVLKEGVSEARGMDINSVPLDADWRPLSTTTAEDFDFAYAQTVRQDSREWKLYAAAPGADESESAGCPADATYVVSCSEKQTADGNEVTSTLVTIADREVGQGLYKVIEVEKITPDMWPSLRVERIVSLQLPGGGMVSAQETVFGVRDGRYEAAFLAADSLSPLVHNGALLRSIELER